jgi:hypothetical protein
MLLSLLLALLLTSLLLLAIWGFKKMAVNLSPIGGVAGQFFDNNGNPLVGGKLYTYTAGTTTPQVTYTSATGVTPNSNPIILNGGGRVPAEIWLTDGLQYKFVLYTSTDTLIGSWDNIIGINSNFVNFVTSEEVQTATAGQTVFTLTTMQYQPGLNNLVVYVDGVNQIEGGTYSFVETSSTVVTFTSGLHVGALVKFVSAETLTGGATSADLVSYTPAGVGAVSTNVQAKLRETVSVKDFGAVGDGVTDDTSAFISAIASVTASGARLYIPEGTYIITSTLTISGSVNINGDGILNTVIKASGNFSAVFTFSPTAYYSYVSNLSINTDLTTTQCVTIQLPAVVTRFYNIEFRGDKSGDLIYSNGDNTEFESCTWFLGTRDTIAVNLDSHNQNTGFLNCRFGGFGTGIVISNNFSPANRVEGARIDNCYFINTGPYNILLGNSLLTAISNCVLDQATSASLFLETGATNVLVNNSWLGLRFLLDGTPTITQSASVATVTMTQPHYLVTGQFISVSGATQPEYNIQEFITVTGPNTFTYPITGSPASPATGAIAIRRPGQSFFAAAGCYGITLANNVIHGGTNGAVFEDTALARTSKVIIANNQFNAAYSASLGLGSLEDCVVTGNVDLSTPPNISWYTVGLHPSYGNYLFDNNHWLTSLPAFFDANSTYRFGNDTGIVGRNRGNNTAVGSVTSLVISHGVFTTPSFVSVIANISLTNIYVDTITSTTFTVNWTGAATPTIYWSAEV